MVVIKKVGIVIYQNLFGCVPPPILAPRKVLFTYVPLLAGVTEEILGRQKKRFSTQAIYLVTNHPWHTSLELPGNGKLTISGIDPVSLHVVSGPSGKGLPGQAPTSPAQ